MKKIKGKAVRRFLNKINGKWCGVITINCIAICNTTPKGIKFLKNTVPVSPLWRCTKHSNELSSYRNIKMQ